jgi:hypothetical protein
VNDELLDLRSFRPDEACPTDDQVLDGRSSLMHAIDAELTPRPAPRRRRRRVALAAAIVAVAAVGVAGAAALGVPVDVTQALGLAGHGNPALAPAVDQAVKRATSSTPDGGTVELWTAPTAGGGTCAYLRRLDASGTPLDPRGVTCQNVGSDGSVVGEASGGGPGTSQTNGGSIQMNDVLGGGGLDLHLQSRTGEPVMLYGKAPAGAAEVAVTLADGTTTTTDVGDGGWYVAAVAADDVSSVTKVEALSADGTTIATVAPPAPPAQTTVGG